MIELIFFICSLTIDSPFYDCDEQWKIEVHNWLVPCGTNDDGTTYYSTGCALRNFPGEPDTVRIWEAAMGNYDGWGMTVLHHELRHLTCACSHDDKEFAPQR